MLGVIGGVGPEATTEFVSRIQSETLADSDQDHIPMIVDIDAEIPPRTPAICGDGTDVREQLCENAQRLIGAGATQLVIASNATHYFYDAVDSATSVPVIHMPEIAMEEIADAGFESVTVLGTDGCRDAELFEHDEIEFDFPKNSIQSGVDTAVSQVKAGQRRTAQELLDAVVGKTDEPYLIACTELSMLTVDGISVDAMDATVNYIVDEFTDDSGLV